MDFEKAFTWVFQRKDFAEKVLVGGAVCFGITIASIFLVGFFLSPVIAGFGMALIRKVARDEKDPMPSWNDFGKFWIDGASICVAWLLFLLPSIVAFGIGFGPMLMTAARNGHAGGGSVGFLFLFIGAGALWALVAAVVMPAVAVHYALEERFGAIFEFDKIFQNVKNHVGDYLLAILIYIVTAVAGCFITAVPLIGFFIFPFVNFLTLLIASHAFGQFGRLVLAKTGAMPSPGQDDAVTSPPPEV